ncbi:MAG: DUF58 domain-containing protein [Treponema sp.]
MNKDFSDKIKRLTFPSRLISYKMTTGIFRSRFLGNGLDFDSIRKYVQEDDAKNIDWNVTARTGDAFVKTYKADCNLNLFLCVDYSLSMNSIYNEKMLKDVANDIIFVLSLAALHSSIPIGGIYFNAELFKIFKASTNKNNVFKMLEDINIFMSPEKKGSPIIEALKNTLAFLKTHSIIFIISDFNISNYEATITKLTTKHDVVCIKLINETNFTLPKIGSIICTDYESNFDMLIPTSSKTFIKNRKDLAIQKIEDWKKQCLSKGAYPLLINTDDDIIKVLCNFFSTYNNNIRKI